MLQNRFYSFELQELLYKYDIVLPKEIRDLLSAEKCSECDFNGKRMEGRLSYFCSCDYGKLMSRREAAKGSDKTVEEAPNRPCTSEELYIICDTVTDLARIYGENNMCPDIKNFSVDLFKAIFSGYAECRGFKK